MTTEEYRKYVAAGGVARQRQQRTHDRVQEAGSLLYRLPVFISLVVAVLYGIS